MNVILIRHTRVVIAAGLCYGRHDVPLADTFSDEAAAVRAALPWTPREVWTSPATRCRELAAVLGGESNVRIEPRIAELHLGAWEGRCWNDLSGPEVDAWFSNPWHARPPGGETASELLARVAAVRDELRRAQAERVAVVTHAGVIRAWHSVAETRPLADVHAMSVPFGSVWVAR